MKDFIKENLIIDKQILINNELKSRIEDELEKNDQDIRNTTADYQDAVRRMFKYMKVIDILKRKSVNIHEFLVCETLDEFNSHYTEPSQLTQQEYNLIMEWFAECARLK